jgi:DNA-binding transcriptional regulator YiaG
MPNFATALKEEIGRLARKEIKSQVGKTQKAVALYRREIAALKRELKSQAKRIESLNAAKRGVGVNGSSNTSSNGSVESHAEDEMRFSARSVKAQRNRLGLSAKDYGALIGVTGLTIYNWEQGKSRPRRAQFAALVAVRGIGKREAQDRLAALQRAANE